MKLEFLLLILTIFISYFLQTNLDFLVLGHIKPDFLFILTIFFAIKKGPFYGTWIGFMGGMLQDINLSGLLLSSTMEQSFYIGTYALPKTLIGFMVGYLPNLVTVDHGFMYFFTLFFTSLLKGILVFWLIIIFYSTTGESYAFTTTILTESLYTACISLVWWRSLETLFFEKNTKKKLGL